MGLNLLRSGHAALEDRDRSGEGVGAGRLGRRLEAALEALAACPWTANSDRKIRDSLVKQAGYALWLFIVQREACGLNDSMQVMGTTGAERGVSPHGAIAQAEHPS